MKIPQVNPLVGAALFGASGAIFIVTGVAILLGAGYASIAAGVFSLTLSVLVFRGLNG